jgi:hypothetical protein
MRPRQRPVPPLVLSAALVVVLATGCGTGGDDAAAPTTSRETSATVTSTTTASTTEPVDDDPEDDEFDAERVCPATDAVEELLGRPVDRSVSGGGVSSSDLEGNSLSYSYQGCSYDLEDDGESGGEGGTGVDGEVAVTRITEHDADGPIFDAVEADVLTDFDEDGLEPLPDLGDDAYRTGTELAVLAGDVMVFVEGLDEAGEPAMDLARELAESLLSEGGGLLGEPELDCDEIGVFAPASFGTLDRAGSAPSTIIIDELTLNLDGCVLDFDGGRSGRVSVGTADQWHPWVAAEQASLFTVQYTAFLIDGHRAFDDGETLLVDDDPERPLRITSEGDDLGDDQADLRRRLAELALG